MAADVNIEDVIDTVADSGVDVVQRLFAVRIKSNFNTQWTSTDKTIANETNKHIQWAKMKLSRLFWWTS